MALTSALYTGLSGLDVNQTQMNVVGNNIANANSVAFKSSRALFSPQFYITDAAGSAPSAEFGGTNPAQRGLGAMVATIQKDFTPGSIEPTGRASDMAIDGNGFFIVKSPDGQRYTRDGSFVLNSANQLVTGGGAFVQGFGIDANAAVVPGQLGSITIPLGTSTLAKATQSASMQGNLDASGIPATGSSILLSEKLTEVGGAAAPTDSTLLTNLADASASGTPLMVAGDQFTLTGVKGARTLAAQKFTVTPTSTVADLEDFYNQGLGIDTSAPTATGTAPAGSVLEPDATDLTSARLVVTGNTGKDNAIALNNGSLVNQDGTSLFSFASGTDAAGIASAPSGESVHTSLIAYDSLGTPLNIDVTAVLESKADTGNTWRFYATSADNTAGGPVIGNGTLTFDANGNIKAMTGDTLSISRAGTGANSPMSMKLDFSTMTQLTDKASAMVMTKQDGFPLGTLNSYSVSVDGTVVGAYSNGLTRNLAKVALATFSNPQGLDDKGGNVFAPSADSGVAVVTSALSLGAGTIRSASLELSNVDISKEFTNLIVASTGFSAASKVITTSDQLIQELLNSSR